MDPNPIDVETGVRQMRDNVYGVPIGNTGWLAVTGSRLPNPRMPLWMGVGTGATSFVSNSTYAEYIGREALRSVSSLAQVQYA